MEGIKNYWWMAITIPALAFLIYIVARRSMKGIAILSTIFGGGVIAFWFILHPIWGASHLFSGMVWLALGLGWLIKDHIKKKKSTSQHEP
jgi:hypothetical protein